MLSVDLKANYYHLNRYSSASLTAFFVSVNVSVSVSVPVPVSVSVALCLYEWLAPQCCLLPQLLCQRQRQRPRHCFRIFSSHCLELCNHYAFMGVPLWAFSPTSSLGLERRSDCRRYQCGYCYCVKSKPPLPTGRRSNCDAYSEKEPNC